MNNPVLTKSFLAGGTIAKYRFVKFGSDDDTVVQAAAATDLVLGATTDIAAASGERTDVVLDGITEIEAGGSVTRGAKVTSDADGKAVAAAPAQGVNNQIGGIALRSAASGDIIPVLLKQSVMQGQ
jgi:hypothetical protein